MPAISNPGARNGSTWRVCRVLGVLVYFAKNERSRQSGLVQTFAVDFRTELIGAERQCSRAQIPDTASLLHMAGSASFGRGLAADAR
jgi:hypothetical protein